MHARAADHASPILNCHADDRTEYHCDALANGLRVVSVPMPHHHSTEVLAYIGVGSRHESSRKTGISHFLEHMLFKGSADYPSGIALERAFESLGGSANAATDTETTCFHSRVHPEHVAEGISLFASMLRRPLFQGLEVERRIILEEALSDLNETGRQINPDNLVASLLFPGHPLGYPTIGTRSTIQRLSLRQLKQHHAAYYTPGNTVLAVAGPIDPETVRRAAKEAFASWNGSPPPSTRPWTETHSEAPALRWVRDAGSQIGLQFAFLVPGREDPRAVDLRVLRRVLGWGGMSRLMVRLREELGLTYAVEAGLALYAEAGLLAVDLAVSPDNLFRSVEAIMEIFSELSHTRINQDELEHTLRNYRYDLEYSRDQVDEMALRYAWGELTGCLRTIAGDLADLEQVTAASLMQTAQQLFVPVRLRGAVVGPYKSHDRKLVEKFISRWHP
jgi:predicted Zn-dependent peptidase